MHFCIVPFIDNSFKNAQVIMFSKFDNKSDKYQRLSVECFIAHLILNRLIISKIKNKANI